MSDYRLYIFLMDGRCQVSTRAKSYDQAVGRIRQWSDDVVLVESKPDPFESSDSKPSVTFAPVQSVNISYADAINAALGG